MPYRVDAPGWLDSSQFDVAATVPQGATREQATLMLQNLLADRFQLKLHHSTKDLSVYILVVAKNGPKLKESAVVRLSSSCACRTRQGPRDYFDDGRERSAVNKTRVRRSDHREVFGRADVAGGSSSDRYDRAHGAV